MNVIDHSLEDLDDNRCARRWRSSIVRGYFTNYSIHNVNMPTAFPGYEQKNNSDINEVHMYENTKKIEKALSHTNSIVYAFLGIKQDAASETESYTNNPNYVGNVMFLAPKSDFKYTQDVKSRDYTNPLLSWMQQNKGYFPEKNADSGVAFDPLDPEFADQWLQYGNFEAFVQYQKGNVEKIIAIQDQYKNDNSGWKAAVDHPDRFAQSIIDIALQFHLDGVDIDWEPLSSIYSGDNCSAEDIIKLASSIRSTADSNGLKDFKISFPITISQKQITEFNNSVPNQDAWKRLIKEIDHVSVMGYDMHLATDNPKITGLHSALYPVVGDATQYSSAGAIEKLHEFGVPYSNIILGFPTYARGVYGVDRMGTGNSFVDAIIGDLEDPTTEKARGISSYRWIMDNLESQDELVNVIANDRLTDCQDKITGSYLYSPKKQIGKTTYEGVNMSFDDLESIQAKVDYAKDHDLAGMMGWSLVFDAADDKSLFKTVWDGYFGN